MAKFYSIANIIDENYKDNCCLTIDESQVDTLVSNYLKYHNEIKTGDILFIGSTYETRQYYGFIMVDKRDGNNWINSEQAISLPFENTSLLSYLSDNNIKYKSLFASLSKYFSELTGYSYEKDEVASDYLDSGIW